MKTERINKLLERIVAKDESNKVMIEAVQDLFEPTMITFIITEKKKDASGKYYYSEKMFSEFGWSEMEVDSFLKEYCSSYIAISELRKNTKPKKQNNV